MTVLVALVRIVVALSALSAVAATYAETASRTTVHPFNFFGYFTVQSNVVAAIVLVVVAVRSLTGRPTSYWLSAVRGSWVAYMVIVGGVYNTLLVGTPGGGGVALPWANVVLHVVVPVAMLLDWVLVADRSELRWRHLWLVPLYPTGWAVVVLLRGATDGWVPYPFLEPSLGYDVIAITVALLEVAVVAVGAGVWWTSRLRRPRPPDR